MKHLLYSTIMLLIFPIFVCEAATSKEVGSVKGVTKWHPGHYYLVPKKITKKPLLKIIKMVGRSNHWRGIQRRYSWAELEPEKGIYDFSLIEEDLSALKVYDKHLVIQIQFKSFKKGDYFAPAYLDDKKYGPGTYEYGKGGTNIALWNNQVSGRLKELYKKLGEQFDADPHVEALVIPETAIGKVKVGRVRPDKVKFVKNLLSSTKTLKESFPSTNVIQYANWPVFLLDDIEIAARKNRFGLGGPDTFPFWDALNNGLYRHYARLHGDVPLATAVQWDNYTAKKAFGPYDPTSIRTIYDFARETLKVNYMFWASRKKPDNYIGHVDRLLRELSIRYGSSGGLDVKCPTMIAPCSK
ncbi:MAG: hypothetical protein ABW162_02540 [Candidatus Sedimenticola sp. PURPLELP]